MNLYQGLGLKSEVACREKKLPQYSIKRLTTTATKALLLLGCAPRTFLYPGSS